MIDEDGYILREVWSAKRIKIPDGYVNRDVYKTIVIDPPWKLSPFGVGSSAFCEFF